MKKIEVFDPPMCCSTGVCGSEVDPRLIQFASDLAWLKEQGVTVDRFNLAQQPAAFAGNPKVCEALKANGNQCLPLVLVEGEIATCSIYPTRDQLASLAGLQTASSAPCCGGDEVNEECCCCGGDDEEEKQEEGGCCGGAKGESPGCCS